ncbi:MAG: tetratricopeptide repeat protein [Elusimicrobia bacterium]|nr:tetratricopeptide repeat protein [Elusimicrobiota bacterium]
MKKNNWKLILLTHLLTYSLTHFLSADMEKIAEEKAAIRYTTTAKSKKKKVELYISKGDEYLLCGEYSYAIDYYDEARTLKKKNPKVYLRLGEAYRLADMKDEAIESYDKALKYGSKDIRNFLGLGIVYKSKYLYEKAEEFYKKAVELERNDTLALTGLADIYSEQGKYPQAIELYEKALSINPTDEIKLKLAMLNYLDGNENEIQKYNVISEYSTILNGYLELEKNPNNAISYFISADEYFLRAVAYLKKKDVLNAKKCLNLIISGKEDTLSKKLAIVLRKHIQ